MFHYYLNTVIRKIELLEEDGVLEVDRQSGKCNRYRIQAYARGIQEVEEDFQRQQEIEKQSQKDEAEAEQYYNDSSQNRTRNDSQQQHSEQPVTHVSPPEQQPVTHVSDVKERI